MNLRDEMPFVAQASSLWRITGWKPVLRIAQEHSEPQHLVHPLGDVAELVFAAAAD